MEKKLKIAVIGCGGISECHLEAYSKNPDVEIYALCDVNEKNLNRRGDEYHVSRRYTDKDQMLAELPEIDAVSVCTWNAAHAECSIAALNAGKHVLCEKPMAMNAEEAQAMLEAAKRNNRLLMIGFVRRFGNDCAIAKDLIEHDRMGDIYYAKATYLRRNGCPGGWFGDKARSGGRNIKSERGYVSATEEKDGPVFNVEDLASAMIRYDNGAVLQVEASFSLNMEKDTGTIELFGDKGGLRLDPELTYFGEMDGYMTNVTLAAKTALSFDGLFANEINHFVHCVQTGELCRNPAEDGVEMMKILDAVYESAATGHEVILK